MNTITVKAAPGVRVPKEGAPRQHITEDEAQAVPASAYYLRRIADGDLVRVPEAATPAKSGTKE
ncbi:MAG: DUF2635 domain-containing protein [Thermodesulfobacteriota bacterium]